MGRALLSHRVSDQAGTVLPYQSVLILEMDAATPLAQTLYAAPTGGTVRTNPLTADALGLVVAYADTPQRAIARVASGDTTEDVVIQIEDDPADTLSDPIPLGNLAAPAANYALVSNGTDVVGALLVNANIDAAAAIAHSKLASTTAQFVLRANGGGTIGAGLLTTSNLDPAAGITVGQLAVLPASKMIKSNGAGTAMVAGFIFNANVDAAANIAITKLADVGAGNVLRSSGAGNVAGKLVAGDYGAGSIATADIAANSITQRPAVVDATATPGPVAVVAATVFADPVIVVTTRGGDVDVHAVATMESSAISAIMVLYLRVDAGGWVNVGQASSDPVGQRMQIHGFHRFTGLSGSVATPVAHTFEMGWSVSAGNGTAVHTNGGRRIMATELRR
jgi:hypothetical protein